MARYVRTHHYNTDVYSVQRLSVIILILTDYKHLVIIYNTVPAFILPT